MVEEIVYDDPLLILHITFITEKERAQRERLRDLSVFERLNGNPGRTSPSLAVKKVKVSLLFLAFVGNRVGGVKRLLFPWIIIPSVVVADHIT